MEKYIVTENTVQYLENGIMVWEDQLNNDKEDIINHLVECQADYEVLTQEEKMVINLVNTLKTMNISYDQWEDDYLVIDGDKYSINIEVTETGYNLWTTNNSIWEKENNLMYGDTSKAYTNHKSYKTINGVINYINKYWEV